MNNIVELSDKVLLEPYVRKRTRTVPQRVRMSNHPILSNCIFFLFCKKNSKNTTTLLKVQFISRLKEAGEFLHNNVKVFI